MNKSDYYNIYNIIRTQLIETFKSSELEDYKELLKNKVLNFYNKYNNSEDLNILKKYYHFQTSNQLYINSKNDITFLHIISGTYGYENIFICIKFDEIIKVISIDHFKNELMKDIEINALIDIMFSLNCDLNSDIEKLLHEYNLRLNSCKNIKELLKEFPDMEKFNIIEKMNNIKQNTVCMDNNEVNYNEIIKDFTTKYFKKEKKNKKGKTK